MSDLPDEHREAVLLLHGLWMNRLVMQFLGAGLSRAGYAPVAMGYRSVFGSLEEHLQHMARRITEVNASRVHLLGHSLGGVIVLRYLAQPSVDHRIGRTVLLGSPVAGCQAAGDFGELTGGSLLLGKSEAVLRSSTPLQIPSGREVGAIAGTQSLGIAPLFVALQGDNDGAVRIDETRLPGMTDHRTLPVSHTGMLFSAEVLAQCIAFFRTGRFSA